MVGRVKAFSRRGNKAVETRKSPGQAENEPPCSHQALEPQPAAASPPQPAAAPVHRKGPTTSKYSRKPAPSAREHEEQEHRCWKARMAAYFDEVQAFELVEATPPPATPAPRQGQQARFPSRTGGEESQQPPEHTQIQQPELVSFDSAGSSAAAAPHAPAARLSGSPAHRQSLASEPRDAEPAETGARSPGSAAGPDTGSLSPRLQHSSAEAAQPSSTDPPVSPQQVGSAAQASALHYQPSPPGAEGGSPAAGQASPDSCPDAPPDASLEHTDQLQHTLQHGAAWAPALPELDQAAGLTAARPMALGMSRRASLRRVTMAPSLQGPLLRTSTAGLDLEDAGRASLTNVPHPACQPRSSLSRPSLAQAAAAPSQRLQACIEEEPEEASPAQPNPRQWEAQEADIAAAMSSLSLEKGAVMVPAAGSPAATALAEDLPRARSDLQLLLHLTGQELDLPDMAAALHLAGLGGGTGAKKLGEGTYGEAFRMGTSVVKILPFTREPCHKEGEDSMLSAADILAEAAIMQELNALRRGKLNATCGFIELQSVTLCRGPYSAALAHQWHAWDAAHGSENPPVDAWAPQQLFALFMTADGGVDLEHFVLASFAEARSALLQVALVLAIAEEAMQFEHRDLHWGNVLLRRGPPGAVSHRLKGVPVRTQTHGVEVTIIDFTLSRLTAASGQVHSCDLSADPALFQGRRGDCQADTYRRMRKVTKGKWTAFCPATNALWLHYLADILLSCKAVAWQPQDVRSLRDFRKQALAAVSAGDLVWNELFEGLWLAGA